MKYLGRLCFHNWVPGQREAPGRGVGGVSGLREGVSGLGVGVWSGGRGVWSEGDGCLVGGGGGGGVRCSPEMATAAVGTHATEMHSC